ncbi:MAG: PAS domain S-box protein [Candidatus Omnitrophota bacterium]
MKGEKQGKGLDIEDLLNYSNSIIATLREPFLVLNKKLRVVSANQAFYDTFKVSKEAVIGQLLTDMGDRQWDVPELARLLKKVISEKKSVKDYEVEHKFEKIGERAMILNACLLHVPGKLAEIVTKGTEGEELILMAIEDITERKRLQTELKESEERFRRAFETSRDGLLLVHKTEGDILNSNESVQNLLGYSPAEFLKKKLWGIGVVKDGNDFKETVINLEREGVIHYEDIPVKAKNGIRINSEVFLVNKAKVIQCNIRDITERKRVEGELAQAKEQQYRTLVENLPQKVFLKDKNSVYISCNENYAKDLKINPEEIAGKTDYDFFPTPLAEKYRAVDKKVMESGKPLNLEEEYAVIGDYLNEKKKAVINMVKVPIRDKDGNVKGLFGLFWDITERKMSEEKIHDLNKQIEFILGATKTGLDIIDSDYNLVYVDPEWQKVYGDPAGKKCYEYFMGKGEECRECGVRKALETKKVVVTEEVLAREGNRPIQVTSIPFQGKDGKWSVAEVNVDITERKRIEGELKRHRDHLEELVAEKTESVLESEKRFRIIFENARDGMLLADIKTKKFIMCNKAICEMLGYSEEEIKLLKESDIHPEEDLPKAMEAFEMQAQGRSKIVENMPVKRKDGGVFYADIITSPITFSGRKYMMGSFRNITERKKAEEERGFLLKEVERANKKLEQLTLRDSHTGLYNHRYLKNALETNFNLAERQSGPLSVIMMDLDYFKSINDVYGHVFGDVILKQFAAQLIKIVRPYDIVVRYGGEEFVIISPATGRKGALNLAGRILDSIQLHNFGDKKHSIRLKLSLSVVSYPEDNVRKGMEMMDLADQILNKAKESGGNRVFSSADMKREAGMIPQSSDIRLLTEKIGKLTKRANQSLIEETLAFAKALELKDLYTGEHVERTVHYAMRIAQDLGFPYDKLELVKQAAMLHDLGKVGISDKILHKKAKLSKREFAEVKKHPQIGVDIIRPIHSLRPVIPALLHHHERWDGKGYPHGLKMYQIPLMARIITIADVYQALISDRPYRKAYSKEKAIAIIKKASGTQFDPDIVKTFIKVLQGER